MAHYVDLAWNPEDAGQLTRKDRAPGRSADRAAPGGSTVAGMMPVGEGSAAAGPRMPNSRAAAARIPERRFPALASSPSATRISLKLATTLLDIEGAS